MGRQPEADGVWGSVRRANYRLVLPEGPLRRFRLPESFGEEASVRPDPKPWPLSAAVGWVGICGCSWLLAHGSLDPLAVLDDRWRLPRERESDFLMATLSGSLAEESDPRVAPSLANDQRASRAEPQQRGRADQSALTLAAPVEQVARGSGPPLPRVSFPRVEVFGAGLGMPVLAPSGGDAAHPVSDVAVSPPSAERSAPAAVALAPEQPSLGQVVAGMVADSPRLPAPRAQERDPFEADFGGASLPPLSRPESAPADPVKLRREQSPSSSAETTRASAALGAGRAAYHWNGGCQASFDQSVQEIGNKPPGKDASASDYQRALGRLEVTRCSPKAGDRVDVCVATQQGRATAITVHTSPARENLAQCVIRQVRALAFPASSGMDLVRTHFDVD